MRGMQLEEAYVQQLKQEVMDFLLKLVNIRSYPNEELKASEYCAEAFGTIAGVEVRKVMLDNRLKDNPLWCPGPLENNDYTGHFNVEVVWKGSGEQLPVYLNAHIDTVTVGEDAHLLTSRLEGDIVHGIGASDDKGSIAAIYTVFKLLSHFQAELPFDVIGHVVVEEEIGGNGALALTDEHFHEKLKGQASLVLEATAGNILPVARCGLWAKVIAHGSAAHTAAVKSGSDASAFVLLQKAVEVIKAVHEKYRQECAKNPPKYYEDYLPVFNVGTFHSGDWPSKISPIATAVISIAVLYNSTNAVMKKNIMNAIASDPELTGKVEVRFVFDRESCVTDFDDPYVQRFASFVKEHGYPGEIMAMRALSDMYFYKVVSDIPCVTFGPGYGDCAHSSNERIDMKDILKCGCLIYDWIEAGKF